MEGLGKCRFNVRVACVAKFRLRCLEQVRFRREAVNAMATGAGYTRFAMVRALEVRVGSRMAAETSGVNLLCGCLAESKDLCHITAAVDVRLTRSVAAFACDPLAAVHQRKARMRIRGKTLGHICVAGHAGIGADVVGRIDSTAF